MAGARPGPHASEGETAREAEIRRITRQVLDEDAELLEWLGRSVSDVREVTDE